MANNITAGQLGSYEFPITANTETTITVEGRPDILNTGVYINVHTGSSPVYVKWGTAAVTVQDQNALQVAPGTWKILANPNGTTTQTLRIISANAANISIEAIQ